MTAPNIVFIILDDFAYAQLAVMPTLFRRLAATGVQFTRAFVAQPICESARATFITGQFPHNHGVTDNGVGYAQLDQSTCLPRVLQQAGYKTSHVAKYLNSQTAAMAIPTGWDDWHCISPQTFYNYSINDNGVVTAKGAAPADYYTTVATARAVAFIAAQAGSSQPFFLQIGHKAPHFDTTVYSAVPYPDYAGTEPGARQFPRVDANFNPGALPGKPAHIAALPVIDAPGLANIDAFWRGQTEMLHSVDAGIGAVVDALAAAGKTGNTVVIVTSDNGFFHGEFRIATQKFHGYEPGVRMPLIVAGPSALVAQAQICERLASHVDIAPTIYALAGVSPSLFRKVDGISLAPLLANPQGPALRNNLLIEWVGGASSPQYATARGERWKYTEYATAEKELYDLAVDPFEMTNLAGVAAYANVQADMARVLAGLKTCHGTGCIV